MVTNLFYVELFVDKQNAAEQCNRTRLSTFFSTALQYRRKNDCFCKHKPSKSTLFNRLSATFKQSPF